MRARSPLRTAGLLGVTMLLAGCQAELYTGLLEQEANEMMALLIHDGLAVDKVQAKDSAVQPEVKQDAADGSDIIDRLTIMRDFRARSDYFR